MATTPLSPPPQGMRSRSGGTSVIRVEEKKKDIEDLIKEFSQMPGNRFCADCLAKDPQWAALPHGVIICEKCAGAHRNLGTHVSVVKSLAYDVWNMEMYSKLTKPGGNSEVNNVLSKYCPYYEQPHVDSKPAPRREFIKKKYVTREYTKPPKKTDEEEAAKRLIHYYLTISFNKTVSDMINLPEIENNPNANTITPPESIWDVEFQPNIIYRYPDHDYPGTELTEGICNFMFPDSIRLTQEFVQPDYRGLVLTDSYNNRQYCCVLVFWERVSPMDILTMTEALNEYRVKCGRTAVTSMPNVVWAPKAIAFVSNYPFFEAFKMYLLTLYRITTTPKVPIPLERFIINVMHEVPVPPLGKTTVQFMVGDRQIRIKRNAPNSLPFIYVNALNLFRCLSLSNVVTVFNALLQEKKVVLISSHFSSIIDASETLITLLYPLELQGVYMPILPEKLLEFLHSPVPFLAGVHASEISQEYEDLVYVYLDADRLMSTCDEIAAMPKKAENKLRKSLSELIPWYKEQEVKSISSGKRIKNRHNQNESGHDLSSLASGTSLSKQVDFSLDILPVSHWLTQSGATISNESERKQNEASQTEKIVREIQRQFLRFFTAILENYRTFFYKNKKENLWEWDRTKFLDEWSDKASRPFVEAITSTQLFQAFLQLREEQMDRKRRDWSHEIRHFDEEIVAKRNRSAFAHKETTPFLDSKEWNHEGTYVATQPNSQDLDETEYSYDSFPTLRKERFGKLRKITNLQWDVKSVKSHKMNDQTRKALQQLMAMQHAKRLEHIRSWDKFEENVFEVQLFVRSMLARLEFVRMKQSVITIQQNYSILLQTKKDRIKYLKQRSACLSIQASLRCYIAKQYARKQIYHKNVVMLQASIRTYLAIKSKHKTNEAALTLQSAFATRKAQVSTFKKLDAIEIMQSFMKAVQERERHLRTLSQIARCQAVLRGTLVRSRQTKFLDKTISGIRQELLQLWDATYTSLMYRAKFWIVYEKATYLNLAIHHEEVDRCKALLARYEKSDKALKEARGRFDGEKKELKRMLKEEVPEQVKESVYATFGINAKSKHKKDNLMNSLFNVKDEIIMTKYTPRLCSTTLLTICSTQAAAIMDVTSQVELRRAERIRKNLMLTVMGSMSSIQSLQRGLQTQINKNKRMNRKVDNLKEELGHTQEKLKKYKQHHRMSTRSKKYVFSHKFNMSPLVPPHSGGRVLSLSKSPDVSDTNITPAPDGLGSAAHRRFSDAFQHRESLRKMSGKNGKGESSTPRVTTSRMSNNNGSSSAVPAVVTFNLGDPNGPRPMMTKANSTSQYGYHGASMNSADIENSQSGMIMEDSEMYEEISELIPIDPSSSPPGSPKRDKSEKSDKSDKSPSKQGNHLAAGKGSKGRKGGGASTVTSSGSASNASGYEDND